MESKQLDIGRAGEYIVMADLLMRGRKCFLTDQGINYDVVIDIPGALIKLQVKTTLCPRHMNDEYRTPTYLFHVKRAGKGGERNYSVGEFDGFALVALDTKQIAYLPFRKSISKTVILRDRRKSYKQNSGNIAPYIDEFSLDKFLAETGEAFDAE